MRRRIWRKSPPAKDPVLVRGTKVGDYVIIRMLGAGGTGAVYLAADRRLGRRVAVKVLHRELAADERFRSRFEREWRIAAAIDHPNVVPIYGAGDDCGLLYLVMRYVDGIDLRTLLQEEGSLPVDRALSLVRQVGRALDTAHARSLVHRDVKPENILIVPRAVPTDEDHVYLADFGIAREISSRVGDSRFIGTATYSAPEEFLGTTTDGRTDIYALACVFYECVTGRAPFQYDSVENLKRAHLSETPPSLAGAETRLHPVDSVLRTALAKERERRYATCREFISALAAVVPPTPQERITTPTRRVHDTWVIDSDTEGAVLRKRFHRRSLVLMGFALVAGGLIALIATPAGAHLIQRVQDLALALKDLVVAEDSRDDADDGSDEDGREDEPFPTAAEERILEHVPADIRPSCQRTAAAPGAVAGVQCDHDGIDAVHYHSYETSEAMYDHYLARVGSWQPAAQSCASAAFAEGSYVNAQGFAAGRLACYQSSGRSWIEWTSDAHNIYAFASADDDEWEFLYEWWTQAGPS